MKKLTNTERWLEKKTSEFDQKYGQKCLLELLAEGKISPPETIRFVRRRLV